MLKEILYKKKKHISRFHFFLALCVSIFKPSSFTFWSSDVSCFFAGPMAAIRSVFFIHLIIIADSMNILSFVEKFPRKYRARSYGGGSYIFTPKQDDWQRIYLKLNIWNGKSQAE